MKYLGMGLLVLVGLFVLAMGLESNRDRTPDSNYDFASAMVACKEAITKQLVAPTTAKFERFKPELKAGLWKASVNVDSQNGFGATLRSVWYCEGSDASGKVTALQTN
jgi:hypothetical protein